MKIDPTSSIERRYRQRNKQIHHHGHEYPARSSWPRLWGSHLFSCMSITECLTLCCAYSFPGIYKLCVINLSSKFSYLKPLSIRFCPEEKSSPNQLLMQNTCVDITLFCGFISISTAASIIQQVEFAVNWKHIKERQFEEATSQPQRPLPMTHVYGMQAVLYWIRT